MRDPRIRNCLVIAGKPSLFRSMVTMRLRNDAPDALSAIIPDALLDLAVERLLKEPSTTCDIPHFYCRKCGEYHLKIHPHYASHRPL